MADQPKPVPSKKFGPKLALGSAALVAFLAVWEGGKHGDGSSRVYADKLANNIPTVCNGLTRHVTSTPIVVGEVWSAEKCAAEEQRALINMQLKLETCFTRLPPQSVFDMASSHAWNFGWLATCGSQAMKAWNAGDWVLGCRRLALSDGGNPVWSYVKTGRTVNGKPEMKFVRGLANRRQAEFKECVKGLP